METSITLNASSSVIVAEGRRRSPFGLWSWIVLGIVAFASLTVAVLSFALTRPVAIPSGATVQFSITPSWFTRLPEATKARVPADMRALLDTSGSWPVVIGLYREERAWKWYAVLPRWASQGTLPTAERAGLVKTVGVATGETQPFIYGRHLSWHGAWPKPFAFRLEGALLAELVGLGSDSPWPIVTGRFDGNLIRTDLAASFTEELPPLIDADVSLNIAPLIASGGVGSQKLLEGLLASHKNIDMPELSQWSAWLGPDGEVSQSQFVFAQDVSASQAGALLGAHGFSARRVVELPDNSLGIERVAPFATSTDELLGSRVNPQGEEVELGHRLLRVSKSGGGEVVFEALHACDRRFHAPIALLSREAIQTIAGRFGLPITLPDGEHLYIGSIGKKLGFCVSK